MNFTNKDKTTLYSKLAIPAVILFLAGTAVAGEQIRTSRAAALATSETVAEIEADLSSNARSLAEPTETTEAEIPWEPSLEDFNLAHYFPEDADNSDVLQSYGGVIFSEIMSKDEAWFDNIYDYADIRPATLAARLGRSQSNVLGKYNPKDDRHVASDPSTWTVNSFKGIRMSAVNGDGKTVTPYSNVIDIMSMANVYTYYHGIEDHDLFLSYCNDLWNASHSYSVSMSELYYCDGCLDDDAELRELEAEALAEEESLAALNAQTADGEDESDSEDLENDSDSESTSETTTVAQTRSSVLTQASTEQDTTQQNASQQNNSHQDSTESAGDAQADSIPETTSVPETSPVIGAPLTAAASDNETNSVTETTIADTSVVPTSPVLTAGGSRSQDTSQSTDGESEADGGELASGSDAAAASEGTAGETASEENNSNESSENGSSSSGDSSRTSNRASSQHNCPGHVDLIITLRITGIDEENGLFTKDKIGNNKDNITEGGWPGWIESTIAAAKNLSEQDWYANYGLSISSISPGTPLTPAEVEEYMNKLPADLSQERKDIIKFALESVGRVPYYWGGKPSRSGYEGNNFGVLTAPDYKGRVFKGLDCSGWINWVYWSVTGNRLAYESTAGLAIIGSRIQRSQLQPGDIIIKTGTDAHVIMFLGWTEDGQIQCIHESSARVNNVTVAVREANWPYYRRLIQD